jgi:AraC-like DNA-binding protein
MAEIAASSGFGRPEQMYTVFRRELGVSPQEYRKERQGEDGS